MNCKLINFSRTANDSIENDFFLFMSRYCRQLHLSFSDDHAIPEDFSLQFPYIKPVDRFSFFSIVDAIHKDIMKIYTSFYYPYGCGYVNNLVSKILRNNNVDHLFCYDRKVSNHCILIKIEKIFFIFDYIADQHLGNESLNYNEMVNSPGQRVNSLEELMGLDIRTSFDFDEICNDSPKKNKTIEYVIYEIKKIRKLFKRRKKSERVSVNLSLTPMLIPLGLVMNHPHYFNYYLSDGTAFSKGNYVLNERKELLEKYSNIKIKTENFREGIVNLIGF